jgi:hypothetical protein
LIAIPVQNVKNVKNVKNVENDDVHGTSLARGFGADARLARASELLASVAPSEGAVLYL